MSEKKRWHWGHHLKRLRLDSGFSQSQLGKMVGVPQSHISQLERGLNGMGGVRNGSIRLALMFADCFRCSLDELLGRYDDDRPSPVDFEAEDFDV
jgi:transcriptional regulator with XRE-family HTH domain